MPPLSTFSSQIDGSLYIKSSLNPSRHGGGSALIENGCQFFGSTDQYLQSTNVAADLYVDSKKLLKVGPTDATAVELSKVGINTKVKGSFNVDQTTILTGAVSASSTIAVTGVSTFAAQVNCQSNLNVTSTSVFTGGVTCAATLAVAQVSTLTGPVACGSTLSVVGASNLTGNLSCAGTLAVTGVSTFTDVTASNNVVVQGNLTVNGVTTTIDSQQVLIKDNIIVLNDASVIGKDSGLMFRRNAADSATMFWSNADSCFALATTDSLQDSSNVNVKAYQKLKCAGIESIGPISIPGFATMSITIAGNSALPFDIPGLSNYKRGSFEIIIESDSVLHPTGSVYNYKLVKNRILSDSFSSIGVHQEGDDLTQIFCSWPSDKIPQIYHKTLAVASTPIKYNVKFIRVD